MTAYTAIPDSDIDPESPGTTTLFTRLRDNPIAITEGSSGAPQIQTAAIADGAVTSTKIAPSSIVAGGYTFWDYTAYIAVTGTTSYQAATRTFTVLVAGTIRATLFHSINHSSFLCYARVLKNGVQVQEWSTNSTAGVTRTVDFAVSVGDVVSFQARPNDTSFIATLSNGSLLTDGASLYIPYRPS